MVLAFAALVKEQGWDVGLTVDPSSPDWPVLMIETDAGQVSWHFQAGELPPGLPLFAGKWDGHSTPEKYARLAELVRSAFGLSREIGQDGDTERRHENGRPQPCAPRAQSEEAVRDDPPGVLPCDEGPSQVAVDWAEGRDVDEWLSLDWFRACQVCRPDLMHDGDTEKTT